MQQLLPKPDFTAWFVMQGTIAAMHHRDYRHPINNATLGLYRPLEEEARHTRVLSNIVASLPYGLQYKIGQLVSNPGRLRHFYFRKTEIANEARILLESGAVEQVVILGAGLDVLALRYAAQFPRARFIEIDMGATQQFKKAAFKEHGTIMPRNHEFIEGDLRNPMPAILANSQLFRQGAPTLWIGEGLFMFIPEDNVIRIMREIKELSAAGSRLIFTTLRSQNMSKGIGQWLQNVFLNKEDCALKWTIPFETTREFLGRVGLVAEKQVECDVLHKNHMREKFTTNHNFAEDIHIAIHKNM